MKKLVIIISLCIVYALGYFFGSHNYDKEENRWYNAKEALKCERQLCNAVFEMLHDYYQYLDEVRDEDDNVIAKHTFWEDCIKESDSYWEADSILQGNWGDFNDEWTPERTLNKKQW